MHASVHAPVTSTRPTPRSASTASRSVSSNESPYSFWTNGSSPARTSSGTYAPASLPRGSSSLEGCTPTTGTFSARALSPSELMLPTTASRLTAAAITPLCTSMTSRAVLGRSARIVMPGSVERAPDGLRLVFRRGEDPRAVLGHRDRVLPVGRPGVVLGHHGPLVVELDRLVGAEGQHRLDRDRHARDQPGALAGLAVVGQERFHVHLGADAVAAVVLDDPVLHAVGLRRGQDRPLDRVRHVREPVADPQRLDARVHGGPRGRGERGVLGGDATGGNGHGRVAVPAVQDRAAVD